MVRRPSICALGIENIDHLVNLYDQERGASKLADAVSKRRAFITDATTSALCFLRVILLCRNAVRAPVEQHRDAIVMSAALLDATDPKILGAKAITVLDDLQVRILLTPQVQCASPTIFSLKPN